LDAAGAASAVLSNERGRVKRLIFLFTVTIVGLTLVFGAVAVAKTLACGGGGCYGTDKPDTMYGSSSRDLMYGLKGSDLMRGNGGDDYINGDGGRDRLAGGSGNDTVVGGAGGDVIAGNGGNDRLNGGKGNDRIEAADGRRDWIDCGSGNEDVLVFDSGLDSFTRNCENLIPRR
jgi:Ca2+-binding RTX toxin-like protein